jgi:hypothetical protein
MKLIIKINCSINLIKTLIYVTNVIKTLNHYIHLSPHTLNNQIYLNDLYPYLNISSIIINFSNIINLHYI